MAIYIAREATKIWRKVSAETSLELQLLLENWRLLLAGLVFQYAHGLAARGVHYLHRPGPLLQDLGFMALPELGQDKGACQLGTLITCSSITGGCCFSRLIKLFAWLMAIIQSLLIIASRKHYTVDVVVAWYTVNLVVFLVDKKLPEIPDRTSGLSLLPVSAKDKDGRMKEELHNLEDKKMKDEFHKLLNGNTVDSTDRRQRVQMNGKHDEDNNHTRSHATPNGT